ncbi:MAG: response regulator [Pseudomonadota bacterium]|nr:response regulator [Pseudomonadota bacterium]
MKVLVVDDKDDARVMLVTLIEMLGYDVRGASTGKEALEIAAAFRPELAICDIGLPDISGYELVEPLRANMSRTAVVYALSGYTQSADRALAKTAGFDAMHAKPLDPEELATILSALQNRMAAFETSPSASSS